MTQSSKPDKTQLRRELRQRRRALSPLQQYRAAQRLCARLSKHPLFVRARSLALYIANDGEISPHLLLQRALAQGKRCYLPALGPTTAMDFRRFRQRRELIKNRFGIAQPPRHAALIAPQKLDLVLLPLVAFDRHGNRLGMGGGFYDRAFAFKRARPHIGPALLGLAHSCQEVALLERAGWDIPLAGVITDAATIRCQGSGGMRSEKNCSAKRKVKRRW